MIYYTAVPSPVGDLRLTSDGISLTGLYLPVHRPDDTHWEESKDLAIFNSAKAWLDGNFSGKPGTVELPLSPAGTAFQQRVWEILLTVPYGQTITYGAIAGQLGETMSAQAVGQAVGANPIAIVIPCHRCVGADGSLTGYAGGLHYKKALLQLEAPEP